MTEAWRELRPGDVVRVAVPLTRSEADLLGHTLEIVRFSKPHGYAVVRKVTGPSVVSVASGLREWHLHPEALVKAEGS